MGFLIGLIVLAVVVTVVVVVSDNTDVESEDPPEEELVTPLEEHEFYDEHPEEFVALPDETVDHSHELKLKFIGTNALYFSDGENSLLVDPFFSRPKLNTLQQAGGYGHIESNPATVKWALEEAGLLGRAVSAILLTHTHFDHAMDVAWAWKLLGKPKVIGSKSMLNILKWHEDASDEFSGLTSQSWSLVTLPHIRSFLFGKFTAVFHSAIHLKKFDGSVPFPGDAPPNIELPAKTRDYGCGEMYALHIEHSEHQSIYIHGSAGYEEGMLDGSLKADTLIVGVAALDRPYIMGNGYELAKEVMKLEPNRIFFSHWDDFAKPLWEDPSFITSCRRTMYEFKTYLEHQDYEKLTPLFLRIFGDVYLP